MTVHVRTPGNVAAGDVAATESVSPAGRPVDVAARLDPTVSASVAEMVSGGASALP